jgi:hypothetical protein
MEYEVELRIYRRPGSVDATGYPDEIEVFKAHKSHNPEFDSIFDYLDDFKYPAFDAITQDTEEERADQVETAYDDEDRASDHAKAMYYHKKYGDAV